MSNGQAQDANQKHFDACHICHSDELGYCDEGVRLAREAARELELDPEPPARSCLESLERHLGSCTVCCIAGMPACPAGLQLQWGAQEELRWFPEPSERNED